MYTKVEIFNLALGALLLTKQIADIDSDKSTENQVLKNHYDTAFRATLQDLNLDATSTVKELELIEADPNDYWSFTYKYPSDCVFLRRIQSCVTRDNRTTQIKKQIAIHNGQKAIFTNQEEAVVDYISKDIAISSLSASAGLAIAYRLAELSAPLISGKGARQLAQDIRGKYIVAKAEAQEHDSLESFNFDDDAVVSEFVEARTE